MNVQTGSDLASMEALGSFCPNAGETIPAEVLCYTDAVSAASGFYACAASAVTIDEIPEEMKTIDQWVAWCWKARQDKKTGKTKKTKVPLNPNNGRPASCTNPKTWTSFKAALQYSRRARVAGIGFVFTAEGRAAGIDIDNCRNPATGEIAREAQRIISWFDTYAEISPSQTGVKIFLIGKPPFPGRRKELTMTFSDGQELAGRIEIYGCGRYFTVTGHRLPGVSNKLEDRQNELDQLCADLFPPAPRAGVEPEVAEQPNQGNRPAVETDRLRGDLTDDELLQKAGGATNGEKFQRLFSGDWQSDYKSQSNADFAFCLMLAFWTGKDPERIDALFRRSKLYREKWDEKRGSNGETYGSRTIQRVIETQDEVYPPRRNSPPRRGDNIPPSLDAAIKIARELVQNVKDNPGAPFEDQALEALSFVEQKNPAEWARIRSALKKAGVGMGHLETEMKRFRSQHKSVGNSTARGPASSLLQVLPGAPVLGSIMVPLGWQVNAHGIARMCENKESGEVETVHIAPAPILITARLKNAHDGSESVRLSWFRDRAWENRVVSRGQIASNRLIVDLAAYGVTVISQNASDLVQYLADFEAVNMENLPKARLSNSLGWQGADGRSGFLWGRTLLHPDGEGQTTFSINSSASGNWPDGLTAFQGVNEGDEQIADGFHTKGTFEDWLRAVSRVAGYPRVMLGIYASLAAPLLAILQVTSFVLDLAHGTSTGKTTALRGAASTWGNPDERSSNGAMWVWDATRVWIERACAVLNNLPMILDDTKRAQKPETVSQIIYDVSSGRGRGRGSKQGMQRSETWSTILLSTGEAPATSFTKHGGMAARVLEIWGFPFERADDETAVVVREFDAAVRNNYGHAGPQFVKFLLRNRDCWPAWRQRFQEACGRWRNKADSNSILIRQSEYVALLEVAADLACQALRLPGNQVQVFDAVWEGLVRENNETNRPARALELVYNYAMSHQHLFYGRHQKDQNRGPIGQQGWFGAWRPDKWNSIAFMPQSLSNLLREEGYEAEPIIRLWRERDWLDVGQDRKRNTKSVKIEGENCWCIVIKKEAFDQLYPIHEAAVDVMAIP